MPRAVKVLDPSVANQIAAGEVIERPASVVKELIENAIDAGSTIISIAVENGGIDLIRVADNGSGMSREDATLALQRHATSKIVNTSDLTSLSTLGFRGEALPSIAAVSKLEVFTRLPEAIEATKITVKGGIIQSIEPAGAPAGTVVNVRDLFFNTPARKKFLKSPVAEFGQIIDIVNKLALAYPQIAFHLVHNQREYLSTTGRGNLLDTIMQIYGKEVARQLITLNYHHNGCVIKGFIGKPSLNRANRNQQVFFVNGRYIKSRLISNALEDAYHTLLMLNRYPFAILSIHLPSSELDVNVHPAKIEIRFSDEKTVYEKIHTAVKQALQSASLIPEVSLETAEPKIAALKTEQQSLAIDDIKHNQISEDVSFSHRNNLLNESPAAYRHLLTEKQVVNAQVSSESQTELEESSAQKRDRLFLLPIGQIDNTYIIAQGDACMFIIDQHAAHERVLYEQYMQQNNKAINIQELLFPLSIELSPVEYSVVNENKSCFRELGFVIDEFGMNSILIRGIPVSLNSSSCLEVVKELIEYVMQNYRGKSPAEMKEGMIITMACKAAIKAGKRLDSSEINDLINQLLSTSNPYTCPHGRPTLIKMTVYELEKKFKRVV